MTAFPAREELARSLRGEVLGPGEEGYEAARGVWNARFDRRPALIARCRDAGDVRSAVRFAGSKGLPLSVKAGGHAYAANTVAEGSLLIDLSPMKGVVVDPGRKTARVEAGVRWGEFDPVTAEHGFAAVGGTVSTVGVAGFTLGGGSGYLSRKHGMAVDNLLAAEVVTADGRIVRASADENPDLLWGLRGGGGNFGVVTSFEIRLHPIGPQVLAGQSVHRFADAPRVLRHYRDFMGQAPDEVQAYAFALRVPPLPAFPGEFHGEIALDLVAFHADPGGGEILRPLLEFGDPILSFVSLLPYAEVQKSFDAALPSGRRWESRAHYLTRLPDEAIDIFTSSVGALPGAFTTAYLGSESGAIARVDPAATAFPHRRSPFSVHLLGGWSDPDQDEEVTSWIRGVHSAMAPFAGGGVYVNLLGTDERDRVRAAYSGNWDRLVALKRKWDPGNLFRMNHNIVPSA